MAGWTFAVGGVLPYAGTPECIPLLVRLSEVFGHSQYFGTERITEYHAWAKAERGRLLRAYAYSGEQGATLWDMGEKTAEEIALGLNFFDESSSDAKVEGYWSRADLRYPEESDVFAIAGKWSINPDEIEEFPTTPGLGIVGDLN